MTGREKRESLERQLDILERSLCNIEEQIAILEPTPNPSLSRQKEYFEEKIREIKKEIESLSAEARMELAPLNWEERRISEIKDLWPYLESPPDLKGRPHSTFLNELYIPIQDKRIDPDKVNIIFGEPGIGKTAFLIYVVAGLLNPTQVMAGYKSDLQREWGLVSTGLIVCDNIDPLGIINLSERHGRHQPALVTIRGYDYLSIEKQLDQRKINPIELQREDKRFIKEMLSRYKELYQVKEVDEEAIDTIYQKSRGVPAYLINMLADNKGRKIDKTQAEKLPADTLAHIARIMEDNFRDDQVIRLIFLAISRLQWHIHPTLIKALYHRFRDLGFFTPKENYPAFFEYIYRFLPVTEHSFRWFIHPLWQDYLIQQEERWRVLEADAEEKMGDDLRNLVKTLLQQEIKALEQKMDDPYYQEYYELCLEAINEDWVELTVNLPRFLNPPEELNTLKSILIHETVRSWNIKGYALTKLEDYQGAIACYDEAIRIDPNYADAWNTKGIIFRKLGKENEAEKCFKEADRLGEADKNTG